MPYLFYEAFILGCLYFYAVSILMQHLFLYGCHFYAAPIHIAAIVHIIWILRNIHFYMAFVCTAFNFTRHLFTRHLFYTALLYRTLSLHNTYFYAVLILRKIQLQSNHLNEASHSQHEIGLLTLSVTLSAAFLFNVHALRYNI